MILTNINHGKKFWIKLDFDLEWLFVDITRHREITLTGRRLVCELIMCSPDLWRTQSLGGIGWAEGVEKKGQERGLEGGGKIRELARQHQSLSHIWWNKPKEWRIDRKKILQRGVNRQLQPLDSFCKYYLPNTWNLDHIGKGCQKKPASLSFRLMDLHFPNIMPILRMPA